MSQKAVDQALYAIFFWLTCLVSIVIAFVWFIPVLQIFTSVSLLIAIGALSRT